MILDALLSVRMVDATGLVVVASESLNPDLFWAIRGAGFNYGIITQATYRVTDLTSQFVTNGDFLFPATAASAVMDFITSFGENLPAEFPLILMVQYDSKLSQVRITLLNHMCWVAPN